MLRKRIIPVLLLKNEGLVKTLNFTNPIYLGDPINAVNIFNEKEVDELIFLDIDASKKCKNINFTLISEIASECFMPFAYGGGIQNLNQVEKLFKLGVEKVIINNSLFDDGLIKTAVHNFGSQSIVASIDVKMNSSGFYSVFSHVKKRIIDNDLMSYITRVESLGIGEIFVNNVSSDGAMFGYDINLIKKITSCVKVPVVTCGGARNVNSLVEVFKKTDVSGAAGGSMFFFLGIHKAVLITYPKYDEFIKSFSKV